MWRALPHLLQRSVDNTAPSAYPLQSCLSQLKKSQTFNLRSHAQFCYREQVVLLACANSLPERYYRIHVLEPQAPLHAHHAERKN